MTDLSGSPAAGPGVAASGTAAPLRVIVEPDLPEGLRAAAAGRHRIRLEPAPLAAAGAGDVVLLASAAGPDPDRTAALAGHLRRGGGAVLVGPAVAAWAAVPELGLGQWAAAGAGPETELRVQPDTGRPELARLDGELMLRDRPLLAGPVPAGADPIATVPWRYSDRPVGVLQRAGGGRLVCLGLGWTAAAQGEPGFQALLYRCLLAAAGGTPPRALGVGLYGFGAIGREHAESALAVAGLDLAAVCDLAPRRREQASELFARPVHAESTALLAEPGVDVVVVGVPPSLHGRAVLECLAAGKHVVCEKPFALRAEEVERILAAAAVAGRSVTVYQSRRWDPDFVALRGAVRSGAIGRPFYMESFIGGFGHPCSYWHSHEQISGGTIYDWGSHYLDWTLQLIGGAVTGVSAQAHKLVWHDVTNADQVRVDITFAGGEQATFLQSDVAAALKPKWYLLGTGGAAVGDWRVESVRARAWTGDLIEDRLQPAEAPATVSIHRPDGGGVNVEVLATAPRRPHAFYRNLADHLLLGEPLAVPPEEPARNVAVMEAAVRSAAEGGRRQEVDI